MANQHTHGQPTHSKDEIHGQPTHSKDKIHGQPTHSKNKIHGQPTYKKDKIHGQPTHSKDKIQAQLTHSKDKVHGQPIHSKDKIHGKPTHSSAYMVAEWASWRGGITVDRLVALGIERTLDRKRWTLDRKRSLMRCWCVDDLQLNFSVGYQFHRKITEHLGS